MVKIIHFEVYADRGDGWKLVDQFSSDQRQEAVNLAKELEEDNRVAVKIIREIFDGKSPDDFDEETLVTIDKFFENSLNVSETSRQLYIHRNTLVYRLDKLQKSTGLDLRVFEDAITFKIALMVVRYMKYMETLEY